MSEQGLVPHIARLLLGMLVTCAVGVLGAFAYGLWLDYRWRIFMVVPALAVLYAIGYVLTLDWQP